MYPISSHDSASKCNREPERTVIDTHTAECGPVGFYLPARARREGGRGGKADETRVGRKEKNLYPKKKCNGFTKFEPKITDLSDTNKTV